MRGLFVIETDGQDTCPALEFKGDEIIILVLVSRSALASQFDSRMAALRQTARELARKLQMQGKNARVIVEWGKREEVIENAVRREQAALI